MNTNHETYIRDRLASDDSTWRVCSLQKTEVNAGGSKGNEFGWGSHEECRSGGAIVATEHEHSCDRTHLMNNIETQSTASTSDTLRIESDNTFVFVSGCGGRSIRHQNNKLADYPWWASVYTATQEANLGALFCTFNEMGVKGRAYCHFKDIDDRIADEFDRVTDSD